MVIAYIIHNLCKWSPLSYCWFGFLIIHMVANMSSYQSMVSLYFRLPFVIFLCSSFDLESSFALLLPDKNLFHLRGDVSVNLALFHYEVSSYLRQRFSVFFLQKWSTAHLSLHIDRLLPDFHAGGKAVAVLHKNSLDIKLCSLTLFLYFSLFSFLVSLSTHRHLSKAGHLDLPLK